MTKRSMYAPVGALCAAMLAPGEVMAEEVRVPDRAHGAATGTQTQARAKRAAPPPDGPTDAEQSKTAARERTSPPQLSVVDTTPNPPPPVPDVPTVYGFFGPRPGAQALATPTLGYVPHPNPPPWVAPPPPDVAPAEEDKATRVGYVIQTGVATTDILRGKPLYGSRDAPALLSKGVIRVHNAGPGTFDVFAFNGAALADHAELPAPALRFLFGAGYSIVPHKHFKLRVGYATAVLPRAQPDKDIFHEVRVNAAVPNRYLTPTLFIAPEFVRRGGVYAAAGLHHKFKMGPVSITPKASGGVAGYKGDTVFFNDVTVQSPVRWDATDYWFLAFTPTYTWWGDPSVAEERDNFLGRSTVVANLTTGFHN